MANEEQQDEIEALKSIFETEFTEISNDPACVMIQLVDLAVELKGPLGLKVTLPYEYPRVKPKIEIPNRSHVLSTEQHKKLLNHLEEVATSYCGMVMVFTLVDETKQWLTYNYKPPEERLQPEEPAKDELDTQSISDGASVSLTEPKLVGGRWDFVVGLVGKPSAGKSTFFNAASNQCLAKMAAYPFTTIEPNVGRAFYSTPCPCQQMAARCNAAYGHTHDGSRLLPVTLKDVAGLVPGASEGRGKGNRFLNDLLDADVLMHIVDVSGCTDENGEQTTNYDPAADVKWLLDEIHLWVYGNIMDKWISIRRNPAKLIDMFTGYHASKVIIHAALEAAGIDNKQLANVSDWSHDVVHKIVQEFLRIRFPIYLVLNKADTDTAEVNIARIKERFPGYSCLPVSAEAEVILQNHQRSGHIRYRDGSNQYEIDQGLSLSMTAELERVKEAVLDQYGSTNVHRALCEAVRLRKPCYAFPVNDLDTLISIDKYRGESPGILRDCIMLKPNTSVETLYTAMLHYPLQLVAGDFIRAEMLEDGKKRIMKKDEIIDDHNNIIKIMTTRKIPQIKPRD